jgi:lambda repressor-like predicted transcriptional regulator
MIRRYVHAPSARMTLLARAALGAVLCNDWDGADAIIGDALAEDPQGGIATLGILWCDSYIHHATGGRGDMMAVDEPRYVTSAGIPADTVDIKPQVRWAARLLVARAQMDREKFFAVSEEIDGLTPIDRVGYYRTLLAVVAAAVGRMPEGWALKRPAERMRRGE